MPESDFSDARLLAFSRRLQFAYTLDRLLEELCGEVRDNIGYSTAWIAVFQPDRQTCKVISFHGPDQSIAWSDVPELPIEGDAYLSELVETGRTAVVEDAQTDPRVNREVVDQLGNRTVINVPMLLAGQPFGTLGAGTFGDEGVRMPSEDELAFMHKLAHHAAVASERIVRAVKRDEEERRRAVSLGERIAEQMAAIREAAKNLGDGDSEVVQRIETAAESAAALAGELKRPPAAA